jgi:membrane peptidoglycan carboxypeptidase
VANEVTSVLKNIGSNHKFGRDAAAKTGTWQSTEKSQNSNAWFIGYTKEIATAVWVGRKEQSAAIKDKNGRKIGGGDMPGEIWEQFMKAAHQNMAIKATKLSNGSGGAIGDVNKGDGKAPTPSLPPNDPTNPGNNNPNDPNPRPSTSRSRN